MPQSLAEIKILVVEDDDGREILAYTLAVEGATVMAAPDGPRGPGAPDERGHHPDPDLILPDENGLWPLEQVNQQPQPVPVIAISGFDESLGRAWRPLPSPASCSSRSTSTRCVLRSPSFWAARA